MAYTPQTWSDLPATTTPISAARLTYMETGIDDAHTTADAAAPLASPTFTGVPAAPTAVAGTKTTQLATTAYTHAAAGPAFVTLTDGATVTWATAGAAVNHARVTLGGNRTLDITGEVDGASGTLIVTQDGTGSRTLTLPGGSLAAGGAFTLSTAAGAVDVLAWVYDGTNYFWTIGKAFA